MSNEQKITSNEQRAKSFTSSKPFERILYKQIDSHTKDILSKYQGGFRKKISSQHLLLAMIKK